MPYLRGVHPGGACRLAFGHALEAHIFYAQALWFCQVQLGWGLGGGNAWRQISLAALGMHAWDTSFRFIWGAPPLAVGVHDYYAHARDAVMPGMRNVPIGGKACMPGMPLTNALSSSVLE